MMDGLLTVKVRGALVKYTLDDLQIKTKMLEADPQAQQLVCVNIRLKNREMLMIMSFVSSCFTCE